jgi:uncharacterized protein
MLLEFRIENHRSIREEQVLSMEAANIGDANDPRPRIIVGHDKPILPVVALYGANASGKSNVLDAIKFMIDAINDSQRLWPPENETPHNPFLWDGFSSKPSLYEIAFLHKQVRYEYGFVLDQKSFVEEWLYAWPNGHKQMWFEREANAFNFGEHLKGENKLCQQITRSNSLLLSAAAQNNHQQLTPLYAALHSFTNLNPSQNFKLVNGLNTFELARMLHEEQTRGLQRMLFESEKKANTIFSLDEASLKTMVLDLWRLADFGVTDFYVHEVNPVEQERPGLRASTRRMRIVFQHRSGNLESGLPLEEESKGTRTFVELTLPILKALRTGSLLIIDELEASLHPLLAKKVVEIFNNPETNPKNAQLIFSTHDTNLLGTTLGEPALRRDQVWFTEKNEQGATHLYPLTDYKPRNVENLERGYLQGRYGAIPFLGDFSQAFEPTT